MSIFLEKDAVLQAVDNCTIDRNDPLAPSHLGKVDVADLLGSLAELIAEVK